MSESNRQPDMNRRKVLGATAAGVTAATLAPGVILQTVSAARDPGEPVTSDVRWGMLIDTSKCSNGCNACVTACNDEHGLTGHGRPESDAQWIRKVRLKDKQTGHTQTLPLLCQHCEKPPCVDVCPTGASFRRADGIVLVDKHICIGCRYCMMACPYKARSFIHEDLQDQLPHAPPRQGTIQSCTFCVHRVDSGGTPACVEACTAENHNAMVFGDMNDPDSEISQQLKKYSSRQIRADLELNTGVRYRGI